MSTGVHPVEAVFDHALGAGRDVLFEHEIYDLLAALGVATPPAYVWLPARSAADADFSPLPGDRVVLKIVHPRIVHKSDVGGVRVVPVSEASEAAARMLRDAPRRYTEHLENEGVIPDDLARLSPAERARVISRETEGVLAVEWVGSNGGFGHEILLGMVESPEFGPLITVSSGGLGTEFTAAVLRPDRGRLTLSPALGPIVLDEETRRRVAAFAYLTGRVRGHPRRVSDRALDELAGGDRRGRAESATLYDRTRRGRAAHARKPAGSRVF